MSKIKKENTLTRRDFVGKTLAASAAFTIVPSYAVSGLGHVAPSDKLNIAGIGVGGMGLANLKNLESQNIVGLCDVDWKYAKGAFDRYPNAKKYWDWRKMFDEMGDEIDGVVIATADHAHAVIAANAITMGKHVYLQKPLTHSVYESRLLTKLADKYKVATQMGNQGASGAGVAETCEILWSGAIGDVTKVESFTDRPIWPQGLNTPEKGDWVPDTLNWDLFTGPAKMRPFNEVYHPWNWRGWWDYGTGALGDMACHILHPVFEGLKLGYPSKVQASSSLLLNDSAPVSQAVKLTFPSRGGRQGRMKLGEVDVSWYDGGIKPMLPDNWPAGKEPNKSGGGTFFYGTKDILHVGCYGVEPELLSGKKISVPKTERRVEDEMGLAWNKGAHEMDWVRACKESAENRKPCTSDFAEAGPFNEMVVMGVLAVRLQALNKTLEWDGENMKFTNIGPNEEIKTVIRDGFKIHDGHPTFNKDWTDPMNAMAYAEELVKHTYREGWSLPDMPA
ncbi:Gfo/Idh/MocA family oxidoreductase [Maribacter polysiphoniae]|uniref:Gfo/Idh/MocA family oxidoreductase n=1 Tax=Maribacter polysiphoniae TaxID=429344 RepID=A0A316DVF8_9FLAO|nr:Gfo/Idh/MocA family oxidoreductase [Maribacter polysiphoniae]MBD1262756.1 Gfo/Idh/MocA family oxidoreductase [Maribacter polysiphoniae]PWK21955.1 oxidoreductase family protein [Maribacter polysiphoniae]